MQLYLSAARRLWQELPQVVRSRDREAVRAAASAVLYVVDDAVATLAEGYAVARRDLVRREEALRRELVDDLLRGDSDLGGLVERAEPFGLDLARVHQVALATPSSRLPDAGAAITMLEGVIFNRLGDRDVLVATKEGLLVVLAPADRAAAGDPPPTAAGATSDLGRLMHAELSRLPQGRPWQVAVGRAYPCRLPAYRMDISHWCRSPASVARWRGSMVPVVLSAPKTGLRQPQPHVACAHPSSSRRMEMWC